MTREPKKYIRSPRYEAPKRPCHDCGKPTTDYRCPACRRRWAKSHGVAVDELGGHGRCEA